MSRQKMFKKQKMLKIDYVVFDIYLIFSNICWNTSQLCQLFNNQAKYDALEIVCILL